MPKKAKQLHEAHSVENKLHPPDLRAIGDSGTTINIVNQLGYFEPGSIRNENVKVYFGKGATNTICSGIIVMRTADGEPIRLKAHYAKNRRSVISIPILIAI